MVAWPAAAGVQEDSFAYLPYVASPLVPVDQYSTGFDSGIGTWVPVRWNPSADYHVKHNDGCDSGRCGFLDVAVKSNHSYVIASPLIPGPTRSYTIIFRSKLNDAKDKHQYGAVSSADAAGVLCPGDNSAGCFNKYYEFLVRFRDGGEEDFLEYRIRRIDGHDENNVATGEVLVDWTKAEGVHAAEWNKWEIRFRASGNIEIKANNHEQPAYARDNKFQEQRYFGLIARTNEQDKALVLFDKFEIVKEN
jgi:hypothetical protein